MKNTIKGISINVPSAKGGSVVLIELNNGQTIVRTEGQFAKDLEKSFLKAKDVKDLRGGTIEGDATFHKAGDKYIADENSSAVKTGEAKVGDELTYAKDGFRVEGFLGLEINSKADMLNRSAQASAELMQSIFGFTAPVAETAEVASELAPQVGA